MNVYQMYVFNGNKAGFFVRRDSWGFSSQFFVKKVDGKESGFLSGESPYFNNPKVYGDLWINGVLVKSNQLLSCPGTYAYSLLS